VLAMPARPRCGIAVRDRRYVRLRSNLSLDSESIIGGHCPFFCMITDTASCRRSSDLLRWRAMQDGDDRARFVGILFQPIEGFSRSFKLIFSGALLYGIR
jgi:hypothetical protein